MTGRSATKSKGNNARIGPTSPAVAAPENSSSGAVTIFEPTLFNQLTAKEQAFVQHPLVMKDPVRAAMDSGYSEGWAKSNAHSKKKQLLYYILPASHARMSKDGISLDRIHQEFGAIAFADATELFERVDTDDGTQLVAKDPTLMPEGLRRAIEEITVQTSTVVTTQGPVTTQTYHVILHDKKPALKMLAEMLGGFDPRSREPGDAEARRKQAALFDFMTGPEMETITKIYDRAAKRQLAQATDAEVIEHAETK